MSAPPYFNRWAVFWCSNTIFFTKAVYLRKASSTPFELMSCTVDQRSCHHSNSQIFSAVAVAVAVVLDSQNYDRTHKFCASRASRGC